MNLFLILPIFLVSFSKPALLEGILGGVKNLNQAIISSTQKNIINFETFEDPIFKKPTINFSPNKMVYVRVITQSSGQKETTFKLLDQDHKEIKKLEVKRSNQSPYTFTTYFPAPKKPGVYYLDVKIKDFKGTVFSGQKNINVGRKIKSSVSAKSEVVVKDGGEERLDGDEPLEKKRRKERVYWQKSISEMIKELLFLIFKPLILSLRRK